MNIFKGKNIFITGGTGFLGRYLTKELLKRNVASIKLFSRDELKHYKTQELFNYDSKIINIIGDIRDYSRLVKTMRQADVVIHGAALKRINILEYNIEESIKTNIIGTLNVVNACLANKVEKAVFISTDKACAPVNAYGACKFISERIFSETDYNKGNIKTIFTSVRYGNVLESTGSVIPYFIEKIRRGEEIPLTDKRMTRFMVSPKLAIKLIFNALKYGQGGEVFVPRPPSFKIIDLIELLKEKYKAKNKVKIIGLRPGEKIHELLINESEIIRTVELKNMFVIVSSIKDHSSKRRKGQSNSLKRAYSSKDYLASKKEIKRILFDDKKD